MKEFFKHDHTARHDPKLTLLMGRYGYAGVGVYWCVIEILHEQCGCIPRAMLDETVGMVARMQATNAPAVDSSKVIDDLIGLDLIQQDDALIVSCERVTRNLKEYKDLSERNSRAAKTRWQANAMRTHSERNATAMPEEEDEEQKKTKKRGRFTPPSLDEVKEYFASVGQADADAERMWTFYESKNWMVGKNKMANWHQACHRFYSKAPKRDDVTAYVDQKWPADEWGNQPQAKHANVWYLRQTASGWKNVDNWKASLTLYIEQNEGKL